MSLVNTFMSEFEQIQDDKIREFTVEALDLVPEFYQDMNKFIAQTKKALEYSKVFHDTLGTEDYARDVVTSAILLQDITRYKEVNDGQGEWSIEEEPMHPLSARLKLLPLLGIVGADKFEDILRTIESSHGLNSPIPQVMPNLSDSVYIWILPFVNSLASSIED